MKGTRFFVAITLITSLAILPSAIAGDKASNKAAGPSPTTVVNTILSGAGVPSKTLGINGDFYIDTKNLNLYGPKTKGVWKVATSLKSKDVPVVTNVIGESGAMGQTGAKGATGDNGATGATGPQGVPGIQGLTGLIGTTGVAGAVGLAGAAGTPGVAGAKGDAGATGATGAKGDAGVAGAKGDASAKGDAGATGAKGDAGATGAKGDPGVAGAKGETGTTGGKGDAGATGAKGDPGVAGAKGDAGATGAKGDPGVAGAKGETGTTGGKGDTGGAGAQGVAGISVAKFVTLPETILATGVDGGTSSNIFFTADSIGNYTFEVLVSGLVLFDNQMKLYAEIVAGDMAIGNQFTVASDSISGVNQLSGRQYGFRIIGTAANVALGTSFSVKVGIVNAVLPTKNITFTGRALVNKVGSIG
jgi:hypothetical protein